jgi:hypothetical protein
MCIYRSADSSAAPQDPHRDDRALSYEKVAHVVTQGLGKNSNVFPPGVLCDRCNSYFGNKLEPALMRHPTVASDMHRWGVPGRDGSPRPIIGNWRRSSDGSYWVPMAPPKNGGEHLGKPLVVFLPILDPSFDQLRFRRSLHMVAFNVLAYLHTNGELTDQFYDPCDPRYDEVRSYIRSPRSLTEAWPFIERYDPPRSGGRSAVHLFRSDLGLVGRIRAFSLEFYVDLLNTGNLWAWTQAEGLASAKLIAPGVRYPASPTMEEVPREERWWLRLSDGQIHISTSAAAIDINAADVGSE